MTSAVLKPVFGEWHVTFRALRARFRCFADESSKRLFGGPEGTRRRMPDLEGDTTVLVMALERSSAPASSVVVGSLVKEVACPLLHIIRIGNTI